MELAEIREAAGFSGLGLAGTLGWDQSKVSRIEKGKQTITDFELVSWLVACKVSGRRLNQLAVHSRNASKQTWVLPNGPTSADSRNLRAEEQEAKIITVYACTQIPGLLQTPDYTQVLAAQIQDDDAAVQQVVAERLSRQEVLSGPNAPNVTFYIEEQALLRPVGGPAVSHDQLMHLMFMADWTKVSIRVLRTQVGAHTAGAGEFTLIRRKDKRSVAWASNRVSAVVFEQPEHIRIYETTVKQLDGLALSEQDSRALIARLADECSGQQGDPDASRGGVA
jgi:transcriptional regulator with XRE-family HTH domain